MSQRISVRALVEFLLRAGDIDNRRETGADPEAMLAGGRIHRKIQASMPESYRAEVPLKAEYEDRGLPLLVEGRADGIDRRDGRVIIDEIKGIYGDLWQLEGPRLLHMAQAKCYAAMVVKQEPLERITCQITYCNLDTEEIRRFSEEFTAEELTEWMEGLVGQWFRWAHFSAEHREERNRSAAELPFPYPYRKGQKETAVNVYRAIRREKNLFIQAPTGVGKTLSVVYPSVKAVSGELSEKIFYLTAKTVTRTVAEETFRLLRDRGLQFLTCSITAKEKACKNDVFDCNPEACPYARGHFDRVNDAVFSLVNGESIITAEQISEYAEKFMVCPYELSLDVSVWCDAVIADYNYAFDPRVRLKRYFSEGGDRTNLFLIDEAHNLPDRASEMYSASLKKEDVLELKKLVKPYGKRLTSALDRLNRALLAVRRTLDSYPAIGRPDRGGEEAAELPDVNFLLEPLEKSYLALSGLLEDRSAFPERKEVLPYFFTLRTFLDAAQNMDPERCRIYGKTEGSKGFTVKILCIDPSEDLAECLKFARSAVFFSATLLPVNYYKELLTGDPEEYAVYAESPFDERNRLLLLAGDVSSRYTRRTEQEFKKVAEYIRLAAEAKRGNYLCFFPSYEYLKNVRMQLDLSGIPEAEVLEQRPDMTEAERKMFLEAFSDPGGKASVGLCVLGGVFSEGIDLREEQLIGVIVVGTGLPAINTESELKRKHYDSLQKDGFDYAYRYPGMNKVLQAAGRLIRTDTDRGVILLLDDRFLGTACRQLFPREWSSNEVTDLHRVEAQLKRFWDHDQDPDQDPNIY